LPTTSRNEPWADDLLEILNKATQPNPKERHQTVKEFWQDLSKLSEYIEGNESVTHITSRLSETPQPHFARGYTPIAPQKPRFNTSRELRLDNLPPAVKNPSFVIELNDSYPKDTLLNHLQNGKLMETPASPPIVSEKEAAVLTENSYQSKKHRASLRQFAVFVIFLGLFAGILYATHNYLRGRGILPQISNPFAEQEAIALTDINLRSDPGISNQRIGLVSEDSRLKIISGNDNWYEVQIIQHGRPKDETWAERGWISKKTNRGDDTVKITR